MNSKGASKVFEDGRAVPGLYNYRGYRISNHTSDGTWSVLEKTDEGYEPIITGMSLKCLAINATDSLIKERNRI